MIQITCYQTCKIDSQSWQTLHDRLPHCALNSQRNTQWLGDGYYFWPDSPKFAEWWGENRFSKQAYCITSYVIHINYDDIFDMVGNTAHIEFFFGKLLRTYQELFERAQRFGMSKLPKPTIATVIAHMRANFRDEVFKFKAMKINDDYLDEELSLKFVEKSIDTFPGLTRIQLCVFNDSVDCIRDKKPYFPKEYCDAI